MKILTAGAIALLGTVLATVPAGAPAAVVARELFVPLSGPQLVAGGAVFAPSDLRNGFAVVHTPGGGQGSRVLQAFPAPAGGRVEPELSTSPRRVGLQATEFPGEGVYLHDFQGAFGEALTELNEPCNITGRAPLEGVGVGDAAVAFRARRCTYPLGTDVLTEFSTAGTEETALEGSASRRVAGSFASVGGPGGYAVYDLRSNAVVNRIEIRDKRREDPAYRVNSLDLGDDGAVVYSERGSRGASVMYAPPGATRARRVPLPTAQYYAAKLAGDQLVIARADGLRVRYGDLSTGVIPGVRLELRSVTGDLLRVLATGVEDEYGDERFDVQDGGVTFLRRTCRGSEIHVQPLGAPTARFDPLATCPLELVGRPRLGRDGKRVRLRVSCRGMTADCRGASVRFRSQRGRARPRRVTYAPALADPAVDAPGAEVVLTLSKANRRRLERGGRLAIDVRVGLEDPSDFVAGETGISRKRRGTIVLRAKRRPRR